MTITESPPSTAAPTIGWRRLAIGSGLAMALWAIALQTLAGALIPELALIGTVFAALGVWAGRSSRRWVHATAAVLPLLALGANAEQIAHDLSHPEAAGLFVLGVLSVSAGLLLSIAGFMLWASRRDRAAWPLVTIAGGLLVVATSVGLVAAGTVESVEASPGDVPVQTKLLEFGPSEIVVPAGATGIWVENLDPGGHTFSVGGTDIDLEIPANSSQRVDVDLVPGSYSVFCAIPGHESMTATLIVEG